MCRMLGYAGPPLAPGELISRPVHSLCVQSYRPREMTSGTVNADGWGAALWLDDGRPEPALYRAGAPIWADPNLGWMGERLRARALLAAVRSATPGVGYELTNVQPFARGRLAFVHNGYIERFRAGPQRALREGLGGAAYEAIAGSSDSEHLFALVLDELDRAGAPEGPAEALPAALRAALARLRRVCEALSVTAVSTVLLSDGESLVAARHACGPAPAGLYVAEWPAGGTDRASLGWCVASEPLDAAQASGARWQPVPAGMLALARPGRALQMEAIA
jgi:glutamine amidotransferase